MNKRLFLEKRKISGGEGTTLRLTGEEAKYVGRVLRLGKGDRITLCTGEGLEYRCTIRGMDGRSVFLTVEDVVEADRESGLDITLCQALAKGKKMDLVVQKGTELGVKRFIPFISARSVSRPGDREASGKVERWAKVALEASRQCGRNVIPVVEHIVTMAELLERFSSFDDDRTLKIIPWESEHARGFRDLCDLPPERVVLMVGPEGGFSAEEVVKAEGAGFVPISLGRRVLRTETAALAAVGIVQFLWGDMG